MYTIRQASEFSGFSIDTLRYYEKMGLLKPTKRGPGGVRQYSDDHVQMLASLKCLKSAGLSLEDIKEFIQEGRCFKDRSALGEEELQLVGSRILILAKHLQEMEKQRQVLDEIIHQTKIRLDYYHELLK